MKKGLLLLVVAGAFLVSCGGGTEEQAAKDLCDCYGPAAKMMKELEDIKSLDGLAEKQGEIAAINVKRQICNKAWLKTYDGNVDIATLKEEIKKLDKDVYKLAEKEKLFGK